MYKLISDVFLSIPQCQANNGMSCFALTWLKSSVYKRLFPQACKFTTFVSSLSCAVPALIVLYIPTPMILFLSKQKKKKKKKKELHLA